MLDYDKRLKRNRLYNRSYRIKNRSALNRAKQLFREKEKDERHREMITGSKEWARSLSDREVIRELERRTRFGVSIGMTEDRAAQAAYQELRGLGARL